MPTILVTGAGGQLGRSLVQQAAHWPDWQFLFADRLALDIDDPQSVEAYFNTHAVDFCINAAGYTAVDRAEQEPQLARAVNVDGPKNLALNCQKHHAAFIQISTDYVYHSRQNTPFEEDDPVTPQSVYAQTKWEGENAALYHCPRTLILRTSWVYSLFGHNFLTTMLRFGKERRQLKVVYDQIGTPTFAGDLADVVYTLVDAIQSGSVPADSWTGIFNYSPEGVTSWYDFALAIFELAGNPVEVLPIRSADYPSAAVRPPFSLMSKEKIKSVFQLSIPHWKDSLRRCLDKK